MRCILFGAGPMADPTFALPYIPAEHRIIIAADGGLRHTAALGLSPDMIIGDMDSLRGEDVPPGAILYPSRKNDTDMMLAIKKGLALGAEEFFLFGGMGGRFDHTYANIQSLAYLSEHGAKGWLLDESHRITVLERGTMELEPEYRYLSVFAYGGTCTGVTIIGAEYNVENETLVPSFPLGVSNAHAPGERMKVSVETGSLLIIQTKLQ